MTALRLVLVDVLVPLGWPLVALAAIWTVRNMYLEVLKRSDEDR